MHLTNQAIQNLDILSGDPALLAVWIRRDRVAFYELETGVAVEERWLTTVGASDRATDMWQEFVGGLTAPDGMYLPVVYTPQAIIYTTDDGRMRLYHLGDTDLFLETEGKEVRLEVQDAEVFVTADLDRFLGYIAALDEQGKLHIYQQNIRVGTFDIGLTIKDELEPSVRIARGGGAIFATDGERIILADSAGRVRKRLDTHYFVGHLACSPNGRWVATSDLETGVIRLYSGTDLSPVHQRFAIDLLAEATQVQLLADLPPLKVAPGALAINDRAKLAFAMSGVICVTESERMDALPRAQRLF